MSWQKLFENPTTPIFPVLFRAEKSGQFKNHITAVFPTLPGTSARDFTTYAHVGQHGIGTYQWYWRTRPATLEEYSALLRELRLIYEEDKDLKLKVVHRITQDMARERAKNLTRYP